MHFFLQAPTPILATIMGHLGPLDSSKRCPLQWTAFAGCHQALDQGPCSSQVRQFSQLRDQQNHRQTWGPFNKSILFVIFGFLAKFYRIFPFYVRPWITKYLIFGCEKFYGTGPYFEHWNSNLLSGNEPDALDYANIVVIFWSCACTNLSPHHVNTCVCVWWSWNLRMLSRLQ